MTNIVYVLSNPAMPNLVKIGLTDDINRRMKELYNTAVPYPFSCEYAAIVEDGRKVEKALHLAFEHRRDNKKREFFEIEPHQAVALLQLLVLEEVTPSVETPDLSREEKRAADTANERRRNFNFHMVDIPIGSVLEFYEKPEVQAIVVGKTKIEFEGETHSTSSAASIVLKRDGYDWVAVQGPRWWMFEGEALTERRMRMENEEN